MQPDPHHTESSTGLGPEVIAHLVASHARFLAFLERRVASREQAEDILQAAFVRALDHRGALRDGESASAWFYRLLRNALIDHYRRRDVERRALDTERAASEVGDAAHQEALDEELMTTVCACMHDLLGTLKPEYAEALRQVDLGETTATEYAQLAGITANNASVRLHRARKALAQSLQRSCGTCATHGCLDCSCKPSAGGCSGG